MTWFRVGGAGIPASLKNAMNAVFNKKFGTSGQNYPPNGWPDNVNLLGPLPEKTASGAIAHFEDGADGVPMTSVVAHIAPTLAGTNAVNMVQSGKNFYPISVGADRFTNNGGATHSNDNGTLVIVASTGNASGVYINTSDTLCKVRNVLKWFYDNEYPKTISFDVVASADNISFRITSGSNTLVTIGTTPTRVSHVSTGNNLSLYAVNNSATIRISNLQIEYGSTASSYKPFTAPTTYTANLGRTIYGGTADIVKGEGEDCYGYVDLGAFTWVKVTSNVEKPYFSTTSALNPAYKYMNSNPNVKCSNYSYGSIGSTGTANGFYIIVSSYVRIRDDATENMTVDEFKTFVTGTKLVYELATPGTFTFDEQEIPSLLGVNNLWADEGDSDVTYRADISLALQALGGGGRGLMGMMMQRPEEEQLTEEDPEEVSELEENNQNTEEQEGENDER